MKSADNTFDKHRMWLVVAVDQLGVFGLGRLRAAQEVDLLGDDLTAVAALIAVAVPVLRVDVDVI